MRPIVHQQVMLEWPESPKSLHELVPPENVSKLLFIQSIWAKWVQKWQNWSIWPKFGLVGP